MYAAILAGGAGTRLWPRSRRHQPKQFADITGSGRTMIQATADRLAGLVPPDRLYVVTGHDYAAITRDQLPAIPAAHIILEPSGRNTAPAIGLACVILQERDPEAIVAVLPADHAILDAEAFRAALRRAEEAATSGYIVTVGIPPTAPHTGYGYIRRGAAILTEPPAGLPVYAVAQFLEKPDLATATRLLAAGDTLWNAGMFVFRTDVMLAEIDRQLPALGAALRDYARLRATDSQRAATHLAAQWPTIPAISIDHGVMEHAAAVATVPLDAGWSDVGSWDALEGILTADADANFVARGVVESHNAHGNIVYCDDIHTNTMPVSTGQAKFVALIGVDDLVVVDTGDTLLIGRKEQMQDVKSIVERLRAQGRTDLL